MLSCYQEDRCLASINGDEKYIYYYGNKEEEFFRPLQRPPREKTTSPISKPKGKLMDLRYELLAWQTKVEATYKQQLSGGGKTGQ